MRLTKKEEHFVRTDECDQSFKTLKDRLTLVHVLTLPEGHDDFDASGVGLGRVLM